jgi:hypothetical protein
MGEGNTRNGPAANYTTLRHDPIRTECDIARDPHIEQNDLKTDVTVSNDI